MKRTMVCLMALLGTLQALVSFAEVGEKWEMVTKSEVNGAAMPPITMKVCIQKGQEKNPAKMLRQDDNCKVTNVKTSGSKTTWKMECNNNGEIVTGSGEVIHKGDSFKGASKMSGRMNGADGNMKADYSGRKLGIACDTSDPPEMAGGLEALNDIMGMAKSQMQSAMAEQCEVSNYSAYELISSRFFGASAVCGANQKHACKVISKEVAKKPDVFIKLAKHDETSDVNIATACGIKLNEAAKSICTKVDSGNYEELADYCPEEVKPFQSKGRKTSLPAEKEDSSSDSMLEGAKKLKGLFGF